MLSAAEMAAIQATAAASLDKVCVIQRATKTSDGMGGLTGAPVTIATTRCTMAQPNAALLKLYADRVGNQDIYKVRFAAGQDVRRLDQLLIEGQTFIVQDILEPDSYSASTVTLVSKKV